MLSECLEQNNGDNLLSILNQLRNKTSEILNNPKNDRETEQDFRRTCLLYANYASDPLISQAYREYVSAYKKITSLYLICKINDKSHLFIYDTDNETEEVKILEGIEELDECTSIVKLPNGDLFCSGNSLFTGCALIIDRNYEVTILPSEAPRSYSLVIYFNRSVYCFGGMKASLSSIDSSSRFDLDENRWIKLAKMPTFGYFSYCTIFNGNILIFGYGQKNILLYSIEIDSFSIIPYEFSTLSKMVLINTEERLYLIGFDDKHNIMYESEVGDEYNWKQMIKPIIFYEEGLLHYSYNKGGVYMAFAVYHENIRQYFKFDLNQKIILELSI